MCGHDRGRSSGNRERDWRNGADGKGAILSGDILQVTPDAWVSFMFSYPNYIPLPAGAVRRIAQRIEHWKFDRIYGAFWERCVEKDAARVVENSVLRYLAAIEAPATDGH